jgi:hypothetical protein
MDEGDKPYPNSKLNSSLYRCTLKSQGSPQSSLPVCLLADVLGGNDVGRNSTA